MSRAPHDAQFLILGCLTDGTSVRTATRVSKTSKGTVIRLWAEAGEFAAFFQDAVLRNLPTRRVEADQIWSFVRGQPKNAHTEGHGDRWTFRGIDADSKLGRSWLVGPRTPENTAHLWLTWRAD